MQNEFNVTDTQRSTPSGVTIRPMRPGEAAAVAELHRAGISGGFLSSLGDAFLTRLYRAIAASDFGFVLVAVEAERVIGFVSGATHVGRMYRSILWRRGWRLAGSLMRHVLRPATLRRIWESLRYPSAVSGTFPDAELLSIVVTSERRGSGAAGALVDALLGVLRERGCAEVRVTVGTTLERANAFYIKHGFRKAGEISSHGALANVYVRETGP